MQQISRVFFLFLKSNPEKHETPVFFTTKPLKIAKYRKTGMHFLLCARWAFGKGRGCDTRRRAGRRQARNESGFRNCFVAVTTPTRLAYRLITKRCHLSGGCRLVVTALQNKPETTLSSPRPPSIHSLCWRVMMSEIIVSESRTRTIGIMTTGDGMRRQHGIEEHGAQKQMDLIKKGPLSYKQEHPLR